MWVSSRKLEILLPSIKLSSLILTAMTIFITIHESIFGLFISWPLCLIHPSSELAMYRLFLCEDPKVPLKFLLFVFTLFVQWVLNKQCELEREDRPRRKVEQYHFIFLFLSKPTGQPLLHFEAEIGGRSHHAISSQAQEMKTPENFISQSPLYEQNDLASKTCWECLVLSASCLTSSLFTFLVC